MRVIRYGSALMAEGILCSVLSAVVSEQKGLHQSLKIGKTDAAWLYHVGVKYTRLGECQERRRLLYRAMNLNPHLSPLQTPVTAAMMPELGVKPLTRRAQVSP
jgi:hypothetical protein